jgi:hypothetical protein
MGKKLNRSIRKLGKKVSRSKGAISVKREVVNNVRKLQSAKGRKKVGHNLQRRANQLAKIAEKLPGGERAAAVVRMAGSRASSSL